MFMVDVNNGKNAMRTSLLRWQVPIPRLVIFGPAIVVLLRRIYEAAGDLRTLSGWDALHALHLDAFQLLAWIVALYLLCQLRPERPTNTCDVFGACAVCLIGVLSSAAGLAAFSVFLFLTAEDIRWRAVATVFAALFAHQAVVPIVYDLVVDKITEFDAMLVGAAVKLTIAGATWRGNFISVPSGHTVEILSACCSFHNVSMAALSWVALTKLERPQWLRSDLVVLASAAGCQILLNTMRLYLVAQSYDMYVYWHDGTGAKIYSVVASMSAVLICAYGARLASRGNQPIRPLVAVRV